MQPWIANLIGVLVVLVIVAGIVVYLYLAKKRGATCIGCPHSKKCGGACSCKPPKPEN